MEPVYSIDGFQVYVAADNQWKQNTFFLVDTARSSCIAIDPGYGIEPFLETLKNRSVTVERIIATHTHFDHIAGVSLVQKVFSAPFYCHEDEMKILKQANIYTMFLGSTKIDLPEPAGYVDVHAKIPFGPEVLSVLHVPGHTPGGCIFEFKGTIFTGDTLLRDFGKLHKLPGANAVQLTASRERIFKELPADTVVFPGHGRVTSLAYLARALEPKSTPESNESTLPQYE